MRNLLFTTNLPIGFALVFILVSNQSFADVDDVTREYLIAKEFNCINAHFKQGIASDWDETCYKKNDLIFKDVSADSRRKEIVSLPDDTSSGDLTAVEKVAELYKELAQFHSEEENDNELEEIVQPVDVKNELIESNELKNDLSAQISDEVPDEENIEGDISGKEDVLSKVVVLSPAKDVPPKVEAIDPKPKTKRKVRRRFFFLI